MPTPLSRHPYLTRVFLPEHIVFEDWVAARDGGFGREFVREVAVMYSLEYNVSLRDGIVLRVCAI